MGGELGENGYMYMYGWIPLLLTWNYYNIVCKSAIAQCFANKGSYSQNYGFSCSHVQIWVGPPRKLSTKNWCFWTVVLEKTLESPLDSKEINPKGNQHWIFIGRTDAESETPILWPPDAKSWLIGKDSDAGKDCGQEMGATEDETVGWHHWLNGYKFEQIPGDSEGPRKLGVLQSMGSQRVRQDLATEQQQRIQRNWTELPILS